jgi:hypothetical protein
MQVELPAPGAYAALVLAGSTQTGSQEHDVMAVVLKAAYDLVADAAGVLDLAPAADPDRAALVLADQGRHRYTDAHGVVHVIPPESLGVTGPGDPHPGQAFFELDGVRHVVADLRPPESLDFDLVRESDLALDKARTDVVVEGLSHNTTGAAITVDGTTWLRRAAGTVLRDDTDRNLFGWQGRGEVPRRDVLSHSYRPATDGALPDGDTADFNNVYRRSTGFTTPGDRNRSPLPSGGLLRVFANPAATGVPMHTVRLPPLRMGCRLRIFCGHGPDRPPRWRIVPLADLVADTLVLRPERGAAEILWRGRWPAASAAADRYRAVQLRKGIR